MDENCRGEPVCLSLPLWSHVTRKKNESANKTFYWLADRLKVRRLSLADIYSISLCNTQNRIRTVDMYKIGSMNSPSVRLWKDWIYVCDPYVTWMTTCLQSTSFICFCRRFHASPFACDTYGVSNNGNFCGHEGTWRGLPELSLEWLLICCVIPREARACHLHTRHTFPPTDCQLLCRVFTWHCTWRC